MTTPEAHGLEITHLPYDGPGLRVSGSIAGKDVRIHALGEVLAEVEANLELTAKALSTPELAALAQSVRGAHLAIQAIAFHLVEVHNGIHRGSLNYPEAPLEAYEMQ